MTIFTLVTLTGGTPKVLDLSWLPSRNSQKFNQLCVDEGTITGPIAAEFSPDDGTTWLPIANMQTMTKAGGPYPFQIAYDKVRVNPAGTGTGKVWFV